MTDAPDAERANAETGVTMSLTVWASQHALAWRACVVLADASRHDFVSPFELARFIARPLFAVNDGGSHGLR